MKLISALPVILLAGTLASCGGTTDPAAIEPAGTLTLVITDGPMEQAQEVIFHVTHVDMGHADGSVTRLELMSGPHDIDLMQLQNGMTHDLLDSASVPAGHFEWMELGIDLQQSHFGGQSGGQHGMTMGAGNPLRANAQFQIMDGEHLEFVMDFDLRLGIQQHEMGGMMGMEYQLQEGMHLMNIADVGGLSGAIDISLVDVNNPACDPAEGGNLAYLFDAAVAQPDDLAATDTDGFDGPVATDIVELHVGVGEYRYHFGFVPAGSYRVAFSCSGEWDEEGDDDYPTDPDGQFDFHAFSDPVEVIAGQMQIMDITP
jgi:hypothetical protein